MQFTLKKETIVTPKKEGLRAKLFIILYTLSMPIYRVFIQHKHPKWEISLSEFFQYPRTSLGYQYALFLKENNFEAMANFENHDVLHILLGYQTNIKDESAMQFCLMGNGKKSIYMYAMTFFSILFFPENLSYFYKSYKKGKSLIPFHHLNFEHYLKAPFYQLKTKVNETKQ